MKHPTLTDLALALDDEKKALVKQQARVDAAQRELDAAVEDERRLRETAEGAQQITDKG